MIQKTTFWAAHVAALKLEATTASQYAKQHELSVKSLYYWRRKLAVTKLTHQAETKPISSVLSNKFVAHRLQLPGKRIAR
jgi:transposase-like protein